MLIQTKFYHNSLQYMYIGFPRILLLSFFLLASASLWARPQEPQGPDRDKFLAELRPYQHEFLAKELKLSREQARDFFPVYDAMDDELQQVADETRNLEKQAFDNVNATDTELEAASQAVFAQKQKEGKIELEYYDKFKEILTPRQLLRLKSAERQFTQRLLRQHRKLRRDRAADIDDKQ